MSKEEPMILDETDKGIVEHLRQEHVSNTELARILDVSEGTIRQRLKRLRESGVLKVAAGIDPDALENQQAAMIAVNVGKATLLESKAKEIAQLPHVLAVSIVSGRYDLMAEVLVDSNHGLVDFLTGELSKITDISASESFLLLKSYGKYI
ncbi:MAG: Lrp/AsnC family transcriptional regulator [Spirochaetales bacterium]|nr:Lrp/AsnC family transcriptional regulator [Spirochaetales bacterium]